jgi:hypothetical protein
LRAQLKIEATTESASASQLQVQDLEKKYLQQIEKLSSDLKYERAQNLPSASRLSKRDSSAIMPETAEKRDATSQTAQEPIPAAKSPTEMNEAQLSIMHKEI